MFKSLIRFYQRFISPLSPGSCRFYPTCSEYALWQLQHRPFYKVVFPIFWRICSCQPLSKGGFDYPLLPFTPPSPLTLHKKSSPILWWIIPTHNTSAYFVKAIFPSLK